MGDPKYPDIVVSLSGTEGNAFSILGTVMAAIRRKEGNEVTETFRKEATTGDYDHLLQTCMKWVTIE